jgi:GNAT superfamily N-acetyltransferase
MSEQNRQSADQPQSASLRETPSIVVFRKLGSTNRKVVETHLLRLDATARRTRFGGTFSDRSISQHCERIDWPLTIALGCFIDGQLRGMAELKTETGVTASIAELAITVEPAFQNQGIGTKLLRKLLTIARNRFIRRVNMICMVENRKMQHVADKLEADLTFSEGEVEGRIWPSMPTVFSLVEEAWMDGEALWRAALAKDHGATEQAKAS